MRKISKCLLISTIVAGALFVPCNKAYAAETATAGDAEAVVEESLDKQEAETVVKETVTVAGKVENEEKVAAGTISTNQEMVSVVSEPAEKKTKIIKDKYTTVYDGVDYAPVYDYNFYVTEYGDIWNAFGMDDTAVLRHFVVWGMKEGRRGSENFDVYSYKNAYLDLRNAFGTSIPDYYKHYIYYGKNEGRSKTKGIDECVGAITKLNGVDYSALYDYYYYTSHNGDVKNAFKGDDVKTLSHFVNNGMKEGRQAKENFNVYSYAYEYQDLRVAFRTDLKSYYNHYVKYGSKEGRKAIGTTSLKNPVTKLNGVDYSPVYDYYYYTQKNPDVKNAFNPLDDTAVLNHLINYGMKEGRTSSPNFDLTSYAYKYVDLRRAFKDNFKGYYMHYVNYGKREGRKATGCKALQNYETIYKDVEYMSVYDFNYYYKNNAAVRKVTRFDDLKAIEYFATHDLHNDVMAISWVGDKKDYLEMKKNLSMTNNSSLREAVVNFALQFVGYPYVHAGKSPETGFDCSGFTYYVFKQFGIYASPSSSAQQKQGTEVIGIENALPGDVICRGTFDQAEAGHVGLYIGNGQMVHAADPAHGVVVGAAIVSSRKLFTIRRFIN